MYTGKKWAAEMSDDEVVHGRPYDVAMQLLRRSGCLNKGHHIVVDKYDTFISFL